MSERIRVLLVDDDPLVRAGLRLILSRAGTVEIAGEAGDGREVAAALDRHRADVVLMDIRMPHVDGVAATRLVRERPRPPAVVVLTTFDADDLVVEALRAGAVGFLLKHASPGDIVRAIELAHEGETMLSPSITRRLIGLVAGDEEADARREVARARVRELTAREREVAEGVAQGLSNAEIGAELHMSVGTVKAHVTQLFAKLQVSNRVQVTLLLQDAGGHPA